MAKKKDSTTREPQHHRFMTMKDCTDIDYRNILDDNDDAVVASIFSY